VCFESRRPPSLGDLVGAAVLPGDGRGDRAPIAAVESDYCLALVGQPDGDHVASANLRTIERIMRAISHWGEHLLRVVFNPAMLRVARFNRKSSRRRCAQDVAA
jgi:hypothetical protein